MGPPLQDVLLDNLTEAEGRPAGALNEQPAQPAIPYGRQHMSISARVATEAELKMTFLGGCRLYPKAIAWSILLSSTIIMEGYDLALIQSFFGLPAFKRAYGNLINPGASAGQKEYEISTAWQSGLTIIGIIGEILGLFLNGFLTDRLGYRYTMISALVWLCLFILLSLLAVNKTMLLMGQFFCGVPWGIFQTLSTTYAAEMMPVSLRAYLLSSVNMCWLLGQLCGLGIVRAFVNSTSEWSYRIPFALQWAFAMPILVGVVLAPESPWWLVRHGRFDDARKALLRLTSRGNSSFNVDQSIAMMRHTNDFEKYTGTTNLSYVNCFKGTNLRRTEIACMVWVTQALCGLSLTGYAVYFYERAGLNSVDSFSLATGMYGVAIVGGITSYLLYLFVGRRKLYLSGLVVLAVVLSVAGSVGSLRESRAQSWAVGSCLVLMTFVYDMTIGPVCYILVAEIPSTRLRVKTVVLARVSYNLASIVTNTITPRMLNPAAWDWKGKSALVYVGTTVLCLVWCFWRLPETFGLSYLEIDILFERRAKARKFRQVQVNLENMGYFDLLVGEPRASTWEGY